MSWQNCPTSEVPLLPEILMWGDGLTEGAGEPQWPTPSSGDTRSAGSCDYLPAPLIEAWPDFSPYSTAGSLSPYGSNSSSLGLGSGDDLNVSPDTTTSSSLKPPRSSRKQQMSESQKRKRNAAALERRRRQKAADLADENEIKRLTRENQHCLFWTQVLAEGMSQVHPDRHPDLGDRHMWLVPSHEMWGSEAPPETITPSMILRSGPHLQAPSASTRLASPSSLPTPVQVPRRTLDFASLSQEPQRRNANGNTVGRPREQKWRTQQEDDYNTERRVRMRRQRMIDKAEREWRETQLSALAEQAAQLTSNKKAIDTMLRSLSEHRPVSVHLGYGEQGERVSVKGWGKVRYDGDAATIYQPETSSDGLWT